MLHHNRSVRSKFIRAVTKEGQGAAPAKQKLPSPPNPKEAIGENIGK